MDIFDPGKAKKSIVMEGVAASVLITLVNAFLPVLALSIGANNVQIGMIVAFPVLLSVLFYIPAARAVEVWDRTRLACVVSSFLSRFVWFFAGAMTFLIGWHVIGIEQSVLLLILLVSMFYLFGAFTTAGWTSMVGTIIPEKIRGSFFGSRNRLCAVGSLVAGSLAGFLIDGFGVLGFMFVFSIAGAAGLVSVYFFSKFPDIKFRPEKINLVSELKEAVGDRTFRRFVIVFMLWQFGVYMSSPFMNVYLISGLGAEYYWISILLFVTGVLTIAFQKGWGTVSDMFGHRSILIISTFMASFIPLLWAVVPSPAFAISISILSGIAWSGINLSSFNYMLEISPANRRSIYGAVFWMLSSLPVVIAPVAGGMLSDIFMPLPLLLNGYRGMFIVSFVLRILVVALFSYLLIETPYHKRMPAKQVARTVVGIGFNSVHHYHFHIFSKPGINYYHWVSMKVLSDIKKLGIMPSKTGRQIKEIEKRLKHTAGYEDRHYKNVLKKVHVLRKKAEAASEGMKTQKK